MRNHSSVHTSSRRAALLWITGAVAICYSTSALHAQCPGGAVPDALGCPTLPVASTDTNDSSAPVDINESTPLESPKADRFSEASENGSLADGASYTERPAGNRSELHGHLPSHPEPPTEFQRFVAATTGQMLPVYGASLFSTQPTSFAPSTTDPHLET